ncbi:hypothetical protein AJ80_04801 [Polytolypa hystricis UAMH7299]|uniref:Pyridoxamine 5'-phosphate oxidase N-terminal domain-containing protein n=1 Tax=Polytolypa hystricis (strain UAMH7299) TaxID=1447883 RepID=A0A2B7Y8Q0_POLH7|nr:hypothetical protein AJ80_04801 [Polytolypa hystricis UAMH7299]
MVKYYPSIQPDLRTWILAQPLYCVASAPNIGKHVNLSPKGLPSNSFAILTPNEAAYADATGSGNETISHIRENGRVTVMFCSFEATPRILRLFCRGKVVEWDERGFHPLLKRMDLEQKYLKGARAVIHLDVFKVQTSCGYGVPRLALTTDPLTNQPKPYLQDRDTMGHWATKKIEKNELHAYQRDCNADSLDGLPGLRAAMRDRGKSGVAVAARIWIVQRRRGLELVSAVLMSVLATVVVLCWAGLVEGEKFAKLISI